MNSPHADSKRFVLQSTFFTVKALSSFNKWKVNWYNFRFEKYHSTRSLKILLFRVSTRTLNSCTLLMKETCLIAPWWGWASAQNKIINGWGIFEASSADANRK